ncbi:MAG: hypothetical protein NC923_02340 [Candidatus Omnitrophica bacterium]|nr:hypothetical protein [Candidatus Omnitrophota bacterium]
MPFLLLFQRTLALKACNLFYIIPPPVIKTSGGFTFCDYLRMNRVRKKLTTSDKNRKMAKAKIADWNASLKILFWVNWCLSYSRQVITNAINAASKPNIIPITI